METNLDFEGILARWIDPKAYEGDFSRLNRDWSKWWSILPPLGKFLNIWTRERVGLPVDFNVMIVAGDSPQGLPNANDRKAWRKALNFYRGQNLQYGKEMQIYIYEKWEPWWFTPQREPNPLNTGGYTNAWDTITINYVPFQMQPDILRNLSRVISLELWHALLHQLGAPMKVFDTEVHHNFEKGNWERWDEDFQKVDERKPFTFETLGGSYAFSH